MQNRIDFIVVVILITLATLYSIIIPKDIFIGKSLVCGAFLLVPSVIYLGFRKPKNWAKILFASFIFGTLFGFIFEFIAEYNLAYSVVSTVHPFRILGVLPIDNVIGHTMMVLMTLVFYQHFVDTRTNHKISRNFLKALIPACVVLVGILILYIFNLLPQLRYTYAVMGSFAIIAPLYLAIRKPQFIKNMAITGVFFFFLYLVIEIVAVRNNWWIYPHTEYIGWVELIGYRFPIEELLFWMLFYAATLVSYFEIFIDIHPSKKSIKFN
jgi:hypothetical protein